jgi:putative flippase GtrA
MSGPAQGVAAEVRRFVRANLSSAIASGLEWLLVTGLVVAGLHYLVAAAAGAVTGAVTDFSLKRHWAFDRPRRAAIGHEGLRYLAVSAASLALNLPVAYALVDGLGIPAVPGVIAASVLVAVVWNYPLHRFYVFRGATRRDGLGSHHRSAPLEGDRRDATRRTTGVDHRG